MKTIKDGVYGLRDGRFFSLKEILNLEIQHGVKPSLLAGDRIIILDRIANPRRMHYDEAMEACKALGRSAGTLIEWALIRAYSSELSDLMYEIGARGIDDSYGYWIRERGNIGNYYYHPDDGICQWRISSVPSFGDRKFVLPMSIMVRK